MGRLTRGTISVVVLVVAAACGGSDDSGDWAVSDLLQRIPDTPANLEYLSVTDYQRASAAVGIEQPDGTDDDATAEWLRQVSSPAIGAGSPLPGFDHSPHAVGAWRTELGFSVVDTRASAVAGPAPETLSLYSVAVAAEDIDASVRSDPLWGPELEDREAAGVPYYHWSGDASFDPGRISPVRRLGRGGVMAVTDEVVVRAVLEEPFQAALATGAAGGSVADNEAARALVDALDDAGVYHFFVSNRSATADWLLAEGILDRLEGVQGLSDALATGEYGPGLMPYSLVAGGMAFGEGQHLNVVAFVHDDSEQAGLNVDRLRALVETGAPVGHLPPWSTLYEVRSIDAIDRISIAVLAVKDASPALVVDAFVLGESLFWVAPDS